MTAPEARDAAESQRAELCEACERVYGEVYRVPDELWAKVTGKLGGCGLLCPRCFEENAVHIGLSVYWEAAVGEYPTAAHAALEKERDALKELVEELEELEQHRQRLVAQVDADAKLRHPDFGGCDALGAQGTCSECKRLFDAMKERVVALEKERDREREQGDYWAVGYDGARAELEKAEEMLAAAVRERDEAEAALRWCADLLQHGCTDFEITHALQLEAVARARAERGAQG